MSFELPDIPCTVLLVDDEENILRAVTRLLLADNGDLEVISASSGPQGLELLRANAGVGLILSDQRMPGMSGAEFLQKARELAPDAVRMVLTGYADMAATMDAINKGGASRYLLKPWDDDLLRRTVAEGVEQYRLVLRNRQLTLLVERQNAELSEWNGNLKGRVLEQTATIRRQNEDLKLRNRQITRAFDQTVVAFSRLIAQHSARLQEHTENVTALSVAVATDLGLPPGEVETVRTAALLHDIGVLGIPTRILGRNPADLSGEDRELYLQHAVRGQAAVDEVEELRAAGVLIRHHHELFGGGGFPDGLAGCGIPLGSRIIAWADYVDRELAQDRGEDAVRGALGSAAGELGHRLDPELFSPMEPLIRALYTPVRAAHDSSAGQRSDPAETRAQDASTPAETELPPGQLIEGMRITRNLYSGTGLLLLNEGTILDGGKIASVVRYYRIDPPSGGVFVTGKES